MAPVAQFALLAGVWLGGCAEQTGSQSEAGADLAVLDAKLQTDGSAALPLVRRLTFDSDPGPPAPRMNLVQWNWARQLVTDDNDGVHVVFAQLGTRDINLPADRPDPVDAVQLPPGQIFYKQSGDRGETFTAPTALTARAAGVDSAAVATAGAYVYVIWRAPDAGRLRVFFRRSADGGTTWSSPIPISDNPASVSVSPPTIATAASGDDGMVYVVWADGRPQVVGPQTYTVKEVYLAVSNDHGASFSAARPVSRIDGFSSWTPAIAAWSSTVHVGWTDERDDLAECTLGKNPCREEEYYRRSTDNGFSWGPEVRLTADPPGAPKESWAPSIAAWQGSVHLTYLDKRSGFFQVYYRRSLDGGSTWNLEVQVAADPQYMNAARPTVAVRQSDVLLSWFGFSAFEADVYDSRSADGGSTFSPYRNLTADGAAIGAARMPHVAIGRDHTSHILFYDTRHSDGNGPRIELYHARN